MTRFLPRSLKGQLILLILVGLLLSQAAGFVFILNDQKSRIRSEWLHNMLTRVATVRDVIESTPGDLHDKILKTSSSWALKFAIDPEPLSRSKEESQSESVQQETTKVFGDRADEVNVTILQSSSEESFFEALFEGLWRDIRQTFSPERSRVGPPPARPTYANVSAPLKSGLWLNVTVTPRGGGPHVSPLLVQFATMAAISAIGIVLVLSRLTQPLKELAQAAAALGRGESAAKLDEKGPREVQETIRAFNDMQERLSRFVLDRTKMLAALGHDLRTPITTLRLRAEFIEEDEVRQKILQTLNEMQEMAEATLSFAREEAAQEKTRLVDVGALVSTVCDDLTDTGFPVECADTGSFTIRCRPSGLKRAFRNIVENAVAYGRGARVFVEHKRGDVAVMIDDDGPGIPAIDMERVFSPFVRLENSRNMDTGGVGLGLAIARSIIRNHGGDITLQNRSEGGLRVTIILPGVTVIETPGNLPLESMAGV
jgi:signal transduction histidine kinase